MTLDPVVLTPFLGNVLNPRWIELELNPPSQANTLALAEGTAVIPEGVLDSEDEDQDEKTHIYILTGYPFADGDKVGDSDMLASVQLASISLDGSDAFTFEITDVNAIKVSPEELASLVTVVVRGDGGSISTSGMPTTTTTSAMLMVKVSYMQTGDVSTARLGYCAAARIHRVDPNRRVEGWGGDKMSAKGG